MTKEEKAVYMKAYREKNRDKLMAKEKAYKEKNRAKLSAKSRAYHEKNRDVINSKSRAVYRDNKEAKDAYYKAYRDATRDDINRRARESRENNRDEYNSYQREYRDRNIDQYKARNKAYGKEYRESNRDKVKEMNKAWAKNNLDKRNAIQRQWRKDNPHSVILRTALSRILKQSDTENLESKLGYTKDDFMAHLSLDPYFEAWRNDSYAYHIDHIIPIAAYGKLTWEDEDIKKVCSPRNLQILPAKENLRKSDAIDYALIEAKGITDLLPQALLSAS